MHGHCWYDSDFYYPRIYSVEDHGRVPTWAHMANPQGARKVLMASRPTRASHHHHHIHLKLEAEPRCQLGEPDQVAAAEVAELPADDLYIAEAGMVEAGQDREDRLMIEVAPTTMRARIHG